MGIYFLSINLNYIHNQSENQLKQNLVFSQIIYFLFLTSHLLYYNSINNK